jgi:membrane protein DedA with SNARE-associated domain
MNRHIFNLLREALVHYGYWAVAAALLLENSGVPVPGDNVGYAIGNYGGQPLLERYRNIFQISNTKLARGEKLFNRYGPVTILFARFVFGMRVIAGPLAGVLRMNWKRFAIFNFLGAALWVSVISCAGYFFGSRWRVLTHFIKRFDLFLGVLFVLVVIILWWRSRAGGDGPEASR